MSEIADYLDAKLRAASEEFDRTMAYVNQAVAAERERCAKIAEAETVSGETGTTEDEAYNMACEHIAERIRRGN